MIFKYSSKGRNLVAKVEKEWKQMLFKDWKEIKVDWWISDFDISSNGKDYLIVTMKNKKHIISRNWKEEASHDVIYKVLFWPDGESYAYIASDEEEDWQCFVVKKDLKNNKEYKSENYPLIVEELQYSPDWKSLLFKARKSWRRIIVKDGKESKQYRYVWNILFRELLSNKLESFLCLAQLGIS